MQKSFQFFADQLQSIRSGFISVGLIDTIKVPYNGQNVLISHIAHSYFKNNQICITPFETSLINVIIDVLKNSGFNAYAFSKNSVIVSCPRPSGEQTIKVISQIKKLAEDARIAIRSIRKKIRQQTMDIDEELQALTNQFIEKIDLLANKKIDSLTK